MTILDAPPNAFAEATRPRVRPGYVVEPSSIAWDAVIFSVRGQRDVIACVPRTALDAFFDDLDEGRLDVAITAFLAEAPAGRVLRSATQRSSPGLFDAMGAPGAVVPTERVPGRNVLGGVGGGTPLDARRNKRRRGGRSGRQLLIGAGVVAAVAAVGIGLAVASGGGDKQQNVAAGGAAGAPAAQGIAEFSASYNVTFTVTSVNQGPGTTPPAVGSSVTGQILRITCRADSCTLSFDPSSPQIPQGHTFGLPPMKGDANHLSGSTARPGEGECAKVKSVVFNGTIDAQRDASGAISGFTGTSAITHDAVFEDVGGGHTCATYDIEYSMVGVRQP